MSTLEPVQPSPDQESLDLDQHLTVVVPFMPIALTAPSWNLPPFSGKQVRCAKCGVTHEATPAKHHDKVATYSPCYVLLMNNHSLYSQIGFPEHIDRRCLTCGYEWVEGLADLSQGED